MSTGCLASCANPKRDPFFPVLFPLPHSTSSFHNPTQPHKASLRLSWAALLAKFACVGCDNTWDVLVSGEVSEIVKAEVVEESNRNRCWAFWIGGQVDLHLVELHPLSVASNDPNDLLTDASTGGNLKHLAFCDSGVVEDAC